MNTTTDTLVIGDLVKYFERGSHRFCAGRYQGRVQVGPHAGSLIVRHGARLVTINADQIATGPRTAARAAAHLAGGFTSGAAAIALLIGLVAR